MKLILLCGKAESGKTTSAGMIKKYMEEQKKVAITTSLAKYLKLYAKEISGYVEGVDEKPRELLQKLGDTVRSLDKDFLLKRMDEDIKVYSSFADFIIIDDIRLSSEIDYLRKKYDCNVVQLVRDEESSSLTGKQKKHITETGLDGFNDYDKTIENFGSLEDLDNNLRKYIGDYYEFKR